MITSVLEVFGLLSNVCGSCQGSFYFMNLIIVFNISIIQVFGSLSMIAFSKELPLGSSLCKRGFS